MLKNILSRTILLARTDLCPETSDEIILEALTKTTVRLVADHLTLSTTSGQSALVTAAQLLMRSGCRVIVSAPPIEFIALQPPLQGSLIVSSLTDFGAGIFGDTAIAAQDYNIPVDLTVFFGATPEVNACSPAIRVGWTNWNATLAAARAAVKTELNEWPMGALAAAALVAGEGFKTAMRKLKAYARSTIFDELYAPCAGATVTLAPESTPTVSNLGIFDVVSAGAVTNALYYVLLRLPHASGYSRVMDGDCNDISNLNRNMLLRPDEIGVAKTASLSKYSTDALQIISTPVRFEADFAARVALADAVLAGVDDIPSRWLIQAHSPGWLGIGATDQFGVQASFHTPGLGCAGCLHPYDAPLDGPAPTAAFVSFWSGLFLASMLIRKRSKMSAESAMQAIYFSPLRPETLLTGPVLGNKNCPVGCAQSGARAA